MIVMNYPPDIHHFYQSLGLTVLTYPLTNARVLMQLGYEPLSPSLTKDLFGRPVGCYPNVFSYMGHIKRANGLVCLYRGLTAKICENLISAAVSCQLSKKLRETYPGPTLKDIIALRGKRRPDPEELIYSASAPLLYNTDGGGELIADDQKLWTAFYVEMARESLCHFAAIIASQPLHVICVRMIADYIGQDNNYSGIVASIGQIYTNEGISGFFSGLLPRALGELFTFWISYTLAYFANKYVLENNELQNHTLTLTGILANLFTYPYLLVGNMMAVSGAHGLKAGHPPYMYHYKTWFDCWNHLSALAQLKRGSQFFWRTVPTIKQVDYTKLD